MDHDEHDLRGLRIGFIGAGRVATALAVNLAGQGLRVASASSRSLADAERLAARIRGCAAAPANQAVVDACDLVFVTTPDSAIAQTVSQLRWREGVAAVHCSGATEVSALDSAASDGALIGGFHPLQTFGDPLSAARSLPGCTVTVEAGQPLDATLVALAGRLGCRVNRLPPGMRGRYHAAAGFASQFINALLAEAASIWQTWGASEEDALQALLPLARGTLDSIESAGIAGGMPGPVSRGDVASVEKHLAALSSLGPGVVEAYRLLCGQTVDLALRSGALDSDTAERLRCVVGTPRPKR